MSLNWYALENGRALFGPRCRLIRSRSRLQQTVPPQVGAYRDNGTSALAYADPKVVPKGGPQVQAEDIFAAAAAPQIRPRTSQQKR